MEALDEDEWLEHLEEHLKEIVNISGKDEMTLAGKLEAHRKEVHDRIAREHPELAERFKERRHLLDEHLKERRPEVYELVLELREKKERVENKDTFFRQRCKKNVSVYFLLKNVHGHYVSVWSARMRISKNKGGK